MHVTARCCCARTDLMHAGYDADLVVQILSTPIPVDQCFFLAAAAPVIFEVATGRTVFGFVEFCDVAPGELIFELTTTVHEILHILVCHAPGHEGLLPMVACYPWWSVAHGGLLPMVACYPWWPVTHGGLLHMVVCLILCGWPRSPG